MTLIDKPWGVEEILVTTDQYCIKKLYIDAGHKTSLHYHKKKLETLILQEGLCDIIMDKEAILMCEDEPITVEPMLVHRLFAHRDSVVLEVCTIDEKNIVNSIERVEDDYNRL